MNTYIKKSVYSKKFQSLVILWGLTAISCLVIFHPFLFGDKLVVFNDAGSDTRQQYVMQYATIVNHLRNGNYSLWDLNNGFGASMFSLNMSNVFLMLVYLAGYLFGVGHIPGVIVYLLILQIFLAGTFCFFFLDNFRFSDRSKVIASYIYALNGYILIWGQHYQFGSFIVFLPLLLLLLERAIRRKTFSKSAPLVAAAMVCASVYMSYMALIMTGCYLIYRLVLADGTRSARIRQFFMHCASLVLGIGMGAFIFLPMAYYLLTNSSRLSSGASFSERILSYISLFTPEFYETAFLRSFSSAALGVSEYNGYSNFYEAPVLFFSVLFVIVAVQYICTIHRQEVSKKSKIMQYAGVLFFLFCMFTRLGAAAFNAFAYPFSRHSFIFMPLFAVVTAFVLDRILIQRKLHIPALVLSVLAALAAGVLSYRTVTFKYLKGNAVLICLTALACAAILFFAARIASRSKSRYIAAALLLLCVFVNVSAEGYVNYNRRNVLTTSDAGYWGGLYDPDVADALNYLYETDSSLYRVEKDYYAGSFCMDGMAQGYRGISAYNSTPNSNLEEFVNLIIPNFPIMAKYEYTYRQIGYYTGHSTLFGIKYLLAKENDLQLENYELIQQFGDIYVYKNDCVDSIVRFYSETGDSSLLEHAYRKLDLERMLQETLFLDSPALESGSAKERMRTEKELRKEYKLKKIPGDFADITGDGAAESVEIPLDRTLLDSYERVYLEFDITTPEVSDISVNEHRPMEYHFRTEAGKTRHVQLAVPQDADKMVLSRYGAAFEGTVKNIRLLGSKKPVTDSTASVTMTDNNNDSLLTGTVTTQEDGFLFLPIPYEKGWSAAVDGEETEILRADVGFMSIPVSAGEHEFSFTYRQPLMQEGIYISAAALLIWAALLLKSCVRKKRMSR